MVPVPPDLFAELVQDALDGLPERLGRLMSNVAVVVADVPPRGQPLLGLYEGVPLTARAHDYAGVLPDRITVFRLPLCAQVETLDELVDEIRVTVVHEVAHHFGIDDERLHELGWG